MLCVKNYSNFVVLAKILKELRIKAPSSKFLDPEIRMKEYKKEYENEIKKI